MPTTYVIFHNLQVVEKLKLQVVEQSNFEVFPVKNVINVFYEKWIGLTKNCLYQHTAIVVIDIIII